MKKYTKHRLEEDSRNCKMNKIENRTKDSQMAESQMNKEGMNSLLYLKRRKKFNKTGKK